MLKGKNIILGISGGIAAYKTATLARLLVKAGANVQVVMTPNAREFITPVTMSAITGRPVITDFFSANSGEWHSHVDLGLWADALVIAPATASTIAKMANGVADNMLITTYLSSKKGTPIYIAPAMDLDMMAHPSTQHNIELLRSYGNHIIEPRSGELASHLVGKGRMEEPENIFDFIMRDVRYGISRDLAGRKVLVTAGPTVEKIDPVRFISNFSSGRMGYEIAEEAARRGAEVTLVSGPVNIRAKNASITVVDVATAEEMFAECSAADFDIAVLCAAVADYRPAHVLDKKIKREASDESPTVRLVKNHDIAKALGEKKADRQILIGFALETDNEQANAIDKMRRKNLDAIVLNSLADKGAGFATTTNKVSIFSSDGAKTEYDLKPKSDVANDLFNFINQKFLTD
ncbi:MAG: bifunctional phosphopantothenoylcysteine decarboxylase/phosphopantothenate--cysteine ligase CoaBC [Muribaculaceae bacterium]|nr:bifunctional phosphopantothenoylcysteine decarboxylase/phosphopantothenate--cysteine ligase CoaBC [Muribaculaceae bacterium]